ncbi:MAG: arsenite methyltransferase [Acidimicrobiales bacterium]
MKSKEDDALREAVRERYGAAASAVQRGGGDAEVNAGDGFGSSLYDGQIDDLPAGAVAASLGCGNPTMLANLTAGQVVLDLGSGGGIDVLLSARRVGPTGKVYGLDMTPEMLELARHNQVEAGAENVEFLLGTIEDIPLDDESVDVIISNCVINLSTNKDRVFAEAYRVLRPGGQFAVSDVIVRRQLPEALQELVAQWTGCGAGALLDADYEAKLRVAGFRDVTIEPTVIHDRATLESWAESAEVPSDIKTASTFDQLDGVIANAFIRARK